MDTNQTPRFIVDKKIYGMLKGITGTELDLEFGTYEQEIAELQYTTMMSLLASHLGNEEDAKRYMGIFTKSLEESNTDPTKQLEVDQTDEVMAKANDYVSSAEFNDTVASMVSGYNKLLYDEARPALTQDQKDELNRYIDELDTARAEMVREIDELRASMAKSDSAVQPQAETAGVQALAAGAQTTTTPQVSVPVTTPVGPNDLPTAPTAIDPTAAPIPVAVANTIPSGLPPIDPIGDAEQAGMTTGVPGLPGATVAPDANVNPMQPIDTYPAV